MKVLRMWSHCKGRRGQGSMGSAQLTGPLPTNDQHRLCSRHRPGGGVSVDTHGGHEPHLDPFGRRTPVGRRGSPTSPRQLRRPVDDTSPGSLSCWSFLASPAPPMAAIRVISPIFLNAVATKASTVLCAQPTCRFLMSLGGSDDPVVSKRIVPDRVLGSTNRNSDFPEIQSVPVRSG